VAWIASGTSPGLAVTVAIPPVFAAYATIVLPEGAAGQERYNRAVLALPIGQSAGQRWWLGYLSTGADDLAFPGVTMAADHGRPPPGAEAKPGRCGGTMCCLT
jgi:hypothetical protein